MKEFDMSSATMGLAAQALGCEPYHTGKTLFFLLGGHDVASVCPLFLQAGS